MSKLRLRTSFCCNLFGMKRLLLSLVLLTASAAAQNCPKENDGPKSPPTFAALHGQLIYHDGLRQWFELKLDKPQCGQPSVELIPVDDNWTPLQTARGCYVTSSGQIGIALTGYYSLDLSQVFDKIQPDTGCAPKQPFPDFSHAEPDPLVRSYRVEMNINYHPGDHPVVFHVTSRGRPLTPWQAYASFDLTGGFVLYGNCAKGFEVDKVFGTKQASPSHFDEPRTAGDRAEYDPEGAAAAGVRDLKLVYICVRAH